MYKLTNNLTRPVALPCKQGTVVLEVGETKETSDAHFQQLLDGKYSAPHLLRGDVTYEHVEDTPEPEGVRIASDEEGGWHVFVNGTQVTDESVEKLHAQLIAEEYE